jgi:hypothetical protein
MLRTGVLSGALVVVLALCGSVQAEMIAIVNGSFEDPVLDDAAAGSKNVIPGWVFSGLGADANAKVWNPMSDRFAGADGSGTPQGGDGINVLYAANSGAYGNYTSLLQMLPDKLQAGTYTLTAAVGKADKFVPAERNYIALHVGTASVAQVCVVPADLVSGQFVTRTVTFEVAADNPMIGQNIGVRLQTSLSTTQVRITCFDNVRLEYTPVPEPGTLVLTALGAFLFSKRRK